MKHGNFLKLIGLNVESLETEIVTDINRKSIDEIYEYLKKQNSSRNTTWIILPCSYQLDR